MPVGDYSHWNEEAPRIWWEEEGRHADEPREPDDEDFWAHEMDDEPEQEDEVTEPKSTLANLFAEGQRIPELDDTDFGELLELVAEEGNRRGGQFAFVLHDLLPEAFLPSNVTLNVTLETHDLDPGDPENGPAPDVQTIPVHYVIAISGITRLYASCKPGKHDWLASESWTRKDLMPSQVLRRLVERGILTEERMAMITSYLHQNGLL